MSVIKPQSPIIHIPSFREYKKSAADVRRLLTGLGLEMPRRMRDSWYYHSDLEGWGKVLPDLVFKSSLYKPDKFNCDDYTIKAYIICRERFGLNLLVPIDGIIPQGWHAFCLFDYGDGVMLWEPNDGFPFSGSAFEIGEFGYIPKEVPII